MRAAPVSWVCVAAAGPLHLFLALILPYLLATTANGEAAIVVGKLPDGSWVYQTSYNYSTRSEAASNALARCQQRAHSCYVHHQFNSSCFAVAFTDRGGMQFAYHTDLSQAKNEALRTCRSKLTGNCRIADSFCDTVSEAQLEQQRVQAAAERARLAREAALERERLAREAAERERLRNQPTIATVVEKIRSSDEQVKTTVLLVGLGLLIVTIIYLGTRGGSRPSVPAGATPAAGHDAHAARTQAEEPLTSTGHKTANLPSAVPVSVPPAKDTRAAALGQTPPPIKAVLFQMNGGKPLSASQQVRTIVTEVNTKILAPTRSHLAQIDAERAEAQKAFSQAEDLQRTQAAQFQRESAATRQALEARLQEQCKVDKSVHLPELAMTLNVPSRWQSEMEQAVNLSRLNVLWSYYVKAPRETQIASITNMLKWGGGIAGGSLLLGLMAQAPFFLWTGALGAGLLVIGWIRQESHRSDIEARLKNAKTATQEALNKIQAVVNEVQTHFSAQLMAITSELNAKTAQLGMREAVLARQYSEYAAATSTYIGKVRAEVGTPGESLGAAGWRNCSSPDGVLSFLRLGELIPPSADLDNRLKPSLRLDKVSVPLFLPFAPGKGLSIEGDGATKLTAVPAVQQLAIRLVAGVPPGKLRFTFIDPIGLGQNVAPLLALGDDIEELVGGRVWSEPTHIEQKLAELTQHMENVIQKYLRDEYPSLEDYNLHAGHVVEAYRVVVVCDFPTNFTEVSARRLASIAQNGPRCGVYPVVLINNEGKMPYGVEKSALLSYMACLRKNSVAFEVVDPLFKDWIAVLDGAAPAEVVKSVIELHRASAREGMQVSVPFVEVLERTGLLKLSWQGKDRALTSGGLEVPIGPTGARRHQNFVFGQGTAHHALVIGQTGSGKSNLLHVLISALALKYSPEELELYLIDFKQGVEFKLYADLRLPHARVIAIESEREFGLSVLRGLSAEMDRRGEEFRKIGVPNLADWRARTGQPMPRIVLLIDEFRVLFTAQDSISTDAVRLLDRLVSQGRAFGIHCILASQTLSGSFSLPNSITDQMAVRIVLQCTEADSRLALSDDNPEARLLSRPGEAIYNDQRGLIAGNQRFQAADMGNDEARATVVRTELSNRLAHWQGRRLRPLVFEGHLPARHIDCVDVMQRMEQTQWSDPAKVLDLWVGEPISVKPATTLRLSRQSGGNVLVVVRDEPLAVSLILSMVISIAAQLSPDDASFHVVDMSSVDGPGAESIRAFHTALPQPNEVVGRRGLSAKLQALHDELQRRIDEDQPNLGSIFLVLFGLHRMRDLREEEGGAYQEDASATLRRQLSAILREGPELGIHTLIWCDTVPAADRVDRRLFNECSKRVVGPMSEQESHRIIDDGAASRLVKPHRLIRFDEERPGDLEVFRPYAPPVLMKDGSLGEPDAAQPYCPPGQNWYAGLAQLLSRRQGAATAA